MNEDLINLTDLFDEFYLIHEPLLSETKNMSNSTLPATFIEQNKQANNSVSETIESIYQVDSIKPHIVFKGANKRHITIIYNDKLNDSPDNVLLIANLITKGLNISMDDVAVCRLSHNEKVSLSDFFEELNPQKAILWGCNELAQQFIGETQPHDIITHHNVMMLMANPVHLYLNDSALKQQLWLKIKELFNL